MRTTLAICVAMVVAAGGCDRGATEAECEKMVSHAFEVELKTLDEAAAALSRPALKDVKHVWVKECQEHGKHSEVVCVLKAKTKDDLDKCGPPGQ